VSSPANPLPAPYSEALVQVRDRKRFPRSADKDPREGFIVQRWLEYFDRQASNLSAATTRISEVTLQDQFASIGATDFSDTSLPAGYYEVLIFATVVQAPTTSYSLQVDIDFTYRGQTKNCIGTAMTLPNDTTAVLRTNVPVFVDNASPIRYTVTYASVGATVMKYDLRLILRRVDTT